MNTTSKHTRYRSLDVLRGFAILLMFIFHFSYDLDYFGFVDINFIEEAFWKYFRVVIVTLFLLVMGISLYIATHNGINRKSFLRRLLLLIFYAALVSVGSWTMFPDTWIWFGILHFIALASVLGLLFIKLGVTNLLIGTAIVLVGSFYTNPVFDNSYMQWLGMMTDRPFTEDYVPLFPWFGIVVIGIYLGQFLLQRPDSFLYFSMSNPVANYMALAGRYSIHIYMLHQPVFIGLLWLVVNLT